MTADPTTEAPKDDDNMTPEERLEWLRERGVQVVTPEERKEDQAMNALREDALSTSSTNVSYVLVPADTSKPLQERTVSCPTAGGTDVLQAHLQSAFAGGGMVDTSLLLGQSHATTTLAGSSAPTPSEATLQKVAQQGHVEVFPLVHASERNQFTAINVYVDEVGMLKRLPLNTRVMELAKKAGYDPAPQFYGDVYLGRIQKRQGSGQTQNVPFVLGLDTNPDAPWLEFASTDNLEHQREMNQITGRTGANTVLQPSVDGANGVAKHEADGGFSWTQTEDELEIVVTSLPDNVTSKMCKVQFRPKSLHVTCQGEERIALQLFEKVDVDGCTWTIDRSGNGDSPALVITMEKVEQALWPRVRD